MSAMPQADQPYVLREDREGVCILTLNRPQARNAVDPETAAALYDAFCDAEREDAVLATVLTGAEGAFCSGADLKRVATASGPPPKKHPQQAPMGPTRLLADRDAPEDFVSLSKPLIAAIEGHAVAGGLELALMADMRIASETAVFGVFFRASARFSSVSDSNPTNTPVHPASAISRIRLTSSVTSIDTAALQIFSSGFSAPHSARK